MICHALLYILISQKPLSFGGEPVSAHSDFSQLNIYISLCEDRSYIKEVLLMSCFALNKFPMAFSLSVLSLLSTKSGVKAAYATLTSFNVGCQLSCLISLLSVVLDPTNFSRSSVICIAYKFS